MSDWSGVWHQVQEAVRSSTDRQYVLARVSAIRGGTDTTWDALARAWRRQVAAGKEEGEAHHALGADVKVFLDAETLEASRTSDAFYKLSKDDVRVYEYSGDPPRFTKTARQSSRGVKHGIIGDTQIRPEDDLTYLTWVAHYFADKQPAVVVQLGDMADMASLSSYDSKAKKAVDRRSVRADFEAANRGWQMIEDVWTLRGYKPRKVYILGNHEQRIERFQADNPELAGDVNYDRFIAKDLGWEVYPFLEPVTIDGVTYSHFFPRGPHGRITQTRNGAPNAMTMVKREMRSCTAGHMQGLDVAIYQTSDKTLRGLILGSTYLHDETYLSPQGNRHWRGIALKHSVRDGNYDLCEVPLKYLEEKYG